MKCCHCGKDSHPCHAQCDHCGRTMNIAKEKADDRLDAATLFGFAPGEIVEAAWDITEGLHSPKVICDEGTELRVTGPSGNALHPIRVEKTNGSSWACAVSPSDIRKPNAKDLP